jgi:hypothetical protein
MRQAQHPLPHRHIREYVVDQVRRALRHPAAATTRTEATALARKRHESVEAACAAPEPCESTREPPAPQKVQKLLLHEAGQALAVAEVRRLSPKRLEVVTHDLVEDA